MSADDPGPSFMKWIDVESSARPSRRVWIDVGAHRGQYTFHRAAREPDLMVYAFEPNLDVIRERIGQLANFVVLPYAVSESDGTAEFYINSLSFSSSLNRLNPARIGEDQHIELPTGARLRELSTRSVPTMRLDTFMASLGIEEVEFLKVDAQGHDLSVLRSAGRFIRDIKHIVVEASVVSEHQYVGSPAKDEIVSFLEESGFRLVATETQTAGEEENLTFVRSEPVGELPGVSLHAPRVTVVVPTRNRAEYLPKTIDSILSQDYPNIECIVVDGDSDDGSQDVLASYGRRIRYISEPDRGPFDAINKGWLLGNGEIIAWLNADDVYEPHAVRRAVAFLESHPDVAIVHGSCGLTTEDGRLKYVMPTPEWDLEVALKYCNHLIYQPTAFMRRDAVKEAGWLYPAWTHDQELWVRVALNGGRIRGIPFHLASARVDQPDTYARLPHRYAAAKVEFTKRIFSLDSLPAAYRPLRRRAMSNAYARGIDYLHVRYPSHWWWGLKSLAFAVATDPSNCPGIFRDIAWRVQWRVPFAWAPLHAGRRVASIATGGQVTRLLGTVRGLATVAGAAALVGIWWESRSTPK